MQAGAVQARVRGRQQSPVAALVLALACASGNAGGEPIELAVEVVAEYPHDPDAFTQGLLWHGDRLYESTGQYGASSLRRVELATGAVEQRVELESHLFGEGLERVGDRLVQLTWREGLARVYDVETFELLAEERYAGEGWGLCHDGEHLLRSDGSAVLTRHEPVSLAFVDRVTVTLRGRPLPGLNELECAEGWVYANVYGTDRIVRIDPASGEVRAEIDASTLPVRERNGVLNGIAYRPETATFLLTGKRWPQLFEVIFVPRR